MKTKIKEIGLTVSLLLLAAAVAGADEVDQALSGIAPQAVVQSTRELIESGLAPERAIAVTRAMVEHGFETQQVAEAHRVLLEARKQGLPPDPIINKALEGMAKRVPSSRVVHAMDAVRTRYDFAFQQVEKLTSQKTQQIQMGHAIAAGLTAGLTPKSVESITDGLQERSRTITTDPQEALALETFKTARDMARLGVSPSQTAALLGQALRHQFSARQMQNMRTAFKNDSRSTAPPELAVLYGRSIEQGKSFEGPGGGQTGEGRGAGSTGGAGSGPGGSGPGGGNGHGGPGG
jgi:hypothetical protein